MSSDRAFRIPRAHKDRVQPRQLMAIAATCMSIGVALSGVLAAKPASYRERGTAEYEGEDAWRSAAAGPVLPSLEDAQQVIAAAFAAPTSETSISAATSATAASPEPVTEAPAKKPSKIAKTTLVRGTVTYRCDAATRACPHDRVLEARAFRVLARLPSCRATADALGHADLKLWIEPLAPTRVVFAASTISPSLNLRAVSQCVARDLSKLRATRKTDRFELSLSFGLAARN